jgi:hypothetical protein
LAEKLHSSVFFVSDVCILLGFIFGNILNFTQPQQLGGVDVGILVEQGGDFIGTIEANIILEQGGW